LDEISKWVLARKDELNVNQESIKPLVMGRDLMKIGVSAGEEMGEYLDKLYELQLDGVFHTTEEGLKIFTRMKK
ncbi:MAG: hypothetical protein L0Y73_06685, partial [Candidatus Aminicenantes bacterium]|nr:hypothetical protein [Candidatus Aminicenantes bacterium]